MRRPAKELLQGLKWMDAKTKEKALERLDNMTAVIGYHSDIVDNEMLDHFYGQFRMANGSYLAKYLSMNKHSWVIEGMDAYHHEVGSDWSIAKHCVLIGQ